MGKSLLLHPDLVERIVDHPITGSWLNHPLVYEKSVPEDSEQIARVNERLETKRVAVAKARQDQDWRGYIDLHELGHRFAALASIKFEIPDDTFTELFGELWIDHDGALHMHREFVTWALENKRLNPEKLMTGQERSKLAELPDVIEVYRGFSSDGTGEPERGPSWTLDEGKAKWFARQHPLLVLGKLKPYVASGSVDKEHVIAYFGRRDEEEIVAPSSRVRIDRITLIPHGWSGSGVAELMSLLKQ